MKAVVIATFACQMVLISSAQVLSNCVTLDGVTYTNAALRRIEDNAAVISHSAGVARVPMGDISDDQRATLGIPTRKEQDIQRQKEEAFASSQRQNGFIEIDGKWYTPDKNPYLSVTHDDIQSMTWYETKRKVGKKDGDATTYCIALYVGKGDDGHLAARLKTKYTDKRLEYHEPDWMFYERVRLLGDNGARLNVVTKYPDKQDNNDSYGLSEWSDNWVDMSKILCLQNVKRIQVMFDGKYSYTFDMTTEQLCAFQEMLSLCAYLSVKK